MEEQEIYDELIGDSEVLEQGSDEWKMKRLDMITGSHFKEVITEEKFYKIWSLTGKPIEDKINAGQRKVLEFIEGKKEAFREELLNLDGVTDSPIKTLCKNGYIEKREVRKKYEPTAGADSYMSLILAQMLSGMPIDEVDTKQTDWGNKYEPLARTEYIEYIRKETGNPFFNCEETGFHEIKNHKIGCSPDGLNSDGIGIPEFKCPFSQTIHMKNVRRVNEKTCHIPSDYFAQCVGNAFVCQRQYCDFVSFNPRIKGKHRLIVRRVWLERIPGYVNNMKRCLFGFEAVLKQEKKRLGIV